MLKEKSVLLSRHLFIKKVMRSALIGFCIILLSLVSGMMGYHYFENMSIIDAYVNAAMILSGMGPVSTIKTEAGKIFAGTYALFSGIIFLIAMAIIFAPIGHRFLHKFHLEEDE
jgi:hypothetical protein